jgi:phosphate transport system substrate-binding protein
MYRDTCVAEAALLTVMVNEKDFQAYILGNLALPDLIRPSAFTNHRAGLGSIGDIDKMNLRYYLPFAENPYSRDHKSRIATLNAPSLLRLTENLPRLDGATALYPLYSAFVSAVYPESPPLKADDYRDYSPDYLWKAWLYFPNEEVAANFSYGEPYPLNVSIVQCSKTAGAYQRLIDGETDIIFCYEPSSAETEAARAKGVRFNLTPIGKDAFVFIVNEKNTAASISPRQIQDIYTGRLTNWKSISGNDDVIIPYQRDENSGSQTIFQTIMRGEESVRPIIEGLWISQGMGEMLEMVASDYYNYNSAIGYTFLFYLNRMSGNSGAKPLAIDGVVPSRETIRDGRYPYVRTLYAVTAGNESANTKKFIEWILSAQGQELVEKTGYIPLK